MKRLVPAAMMEAAKDNHLGIYNFDAVTAYKRNGTDLISDPFLSFKLAFGYIFYL